MLTEQDKLRALQMKLEDVFHHFTKIIGLLYDCISELEDLSTPSEDVPDVSDFLAGSVASESEGSAEAKDK